MLWEDNTMWDLISACGYQPNISFKFITLSHHHYDVNIVYTRTAESHTEPEIDTTLLLLCHCHFPFSYVLILVVRMLNWISVFPCAFLNDIAALQESYSAQPTILKTFIFFLQIVFFFMWWKQVIFLWKVETLRTFRNNKRCFYWAPNIICSQNINVALMLVNSPSWLKPSTANYWKTEKYSQPAALSYNNQVKSLAYPPEVYGTLAPASTLHILPQHCIFLLQRSSFPCTCSLLL